MKFRMALVFCIIRVASLCALSNSERWAFALTEIMTVVNDDYHETLNFDMLNETNKKKYAELLKRDWGINNREELLATINEMENDGHSVAFEKAKSMIIEAKDYFSYNMINTYKLSQKQYNYFKYVLSNWNLLKTGRSWFGISAVIYLCAVGAMIAGIYPNQKPGERSFIMQKIQPIYSSWKDYGFDYYMGRVFWASGFGSEMEYLFKTDQIYRGLIGESGYWSQLKWEEALE